MFILNYFYFMGFMVFMLFVSYDAVIVKYEHDSIMGFYLFKTLFAIQIANIYFFIRYLYQALLRRGKLYKNIIGVMITILIFIIFAFMGEGMLVAMQSV